MGSTNKSIKKKLIQKYGKVDFLDRLHIKVPECKKYKSKSQYKKMKQLTYHHIKEKSKGGKATIENGALLTAEHHEWFHQQSEETQQILNDAFQELKRRIDNSHRIKIEYVDDIILPFELNIIGISIDKQNRIQAYNKNKKKRQEKEER